MNLTALALLGAAGLGQPPADADIVPHNTRALVLDINYDPARKKDIDKSYLFVSRDRGQTWPLESVATPDKPAFQYTAPEDGEYWVNMMIVYKNGQKDPPDITRVAPARKLLIDATAPAVKITTARWDGDDLLVAWEVQDKFPNDAATRVLVRPTGAGESAWQPAPLDGVMKRTAKFKPGIAGPVTVKVAAADLAGNVGEMVRDLPAPAASATTTAYLPANPTPTLPPPSLPPETAASGPSAPTGPLPPIGIPVEAVPQPVLPPTASAEPPYAAAPAYNPAPAPAMAAPAPPAGGAAVWGPPGTAAAEPPPAPIAVGSGTFAGPALDAGAPQVINFTRFDLQYQVENGPSGVSRVDLYVTRDDGRTWYPWSKHTGGESPLRVVLDTSFNQQVEGNYGFRLVPVSGAGLADGAPTAGTPPDLRVQVDATPPVIKVYAPVADAQQRNALVLRWEAHDRNFGRDPIAIEWSEHPGGPWQPVTGGGGPAQVVAGLTTGAARVANSGTYSWLLPAGLATHKVYLKFTAWDAAGNRSEVVTPTPVTVDLTKPRAKIQGILGGTVGR